MKIDDDVFIRYITRMLKCGVLADGELRRTDDGTPQGSVCSPILSNIFAHYAIDLWFNDEVVPRTNCGIFIVRYCDDLVIGCKGSDSERILNSLKERLKRFSLCLNTEKTKVVKFNRFEGAIFNQGIFDFLGFTFYIAKSRKGWATVKLKTSKKKFRAKLSNVKKWCEENRHKGKILEIWTVFISKLRGHIQYYGVSHNLFYVERFLYEAKRIFFKWMNRRSQKKSLNWDQFQLFLDRFPMPKARVCHRLF